jgi:mannose-6-phosphate isomerase-like protein (cupin superfamily)
MNRPDRSSSASTRPQGLLVRSQDSNGAFALIDYLIAPRTLVAPLHTHRREDEYSYVLAGCLGAQIGEETVLAGPNELLSKPKGIPHTLWNPGSTPTRVLELICPGGFEEALREFARRDPPSPARLQQLWAIYEIEMHTESVAELLRRHELTAVAI